ncbi:MAG: alpha/beta hydrolase [Bacteriovorax sp.]
MKNIIIIFVLLLFTQLASAEIAIYTAESSSPHPLSEMSEILEKYTLENPDKNILFYVHGRKHHLETILPRLPAMEKSYNVKVIMFHWDSWSSLLTRPVENAEMASESLNEAFREIRDFKELHQKYFEQHKINLLCHSMGNLVLQYFTQKYLDRDWMNSPRPLFENLISVGADVPLVNHKEWLSKFNLARNKSIFMNNADDVLIPSYILDVKNGDFFSYKLGLGLDNFSGLKDHIKEKLVKEATYVDLSGVLHSQHAYFLPDSPVLVTIFSKLTNGKKFEINDEEKKSLKINVKMTGNIFYVNSK